MKRKIFAVILSIALLISISGCVSVIAHDGMLLRVNNTDINNTTTPENVMAMAKPNVLVMKVESTSIYSL